MSTVSTDLDALHDLNHDYIASVQKGDVWRFDEILSAEFFCSNPDGSLTYSNTYPTGGLGGVLTGSVVDHLASQGSVADRFAAGAIIGVALTVSLVGVSRPVNTPVSPSRMSRPESGFRSVTTGIPAAASR